MNAPTTQVVIKQELGPLSSTTVFVIPPTISEHNIMIAVLNKIRHQFPGAWAVVQKQEREERGISPFSPLSKIKVTTREHLGLPAEDPIQDVPV